jgi:hypothetical protein
MLGTRSATPSAVRCPDVGALTDQSMASVNGRRSNATFQKLRKPPSPWCTVHTAIGSQTRNGTRRRAGRQHRPRLRRRRAYHRAASASPQNSADELVHGPSKLPFFQGALSEVDLQAVKSWNRVAAVVTKPQGWTDSAIKICPV